MALITKCADCGKTLILGLRSFYEHPLKEGQYVCQECDTKYLNIRNEMHLKTLEKVDNNLIDTFSSYNSDSLSNNNSDETNSTDNSTRLKKLKALYQDGALTKDEYEKEYNKIMESL